MERICIHRPLSYAERSEHCAGAVTGSVRASVTGSLTRSLTGKHRYVSIAARESAACVEHLLLSITETGDRFHKTSVIPAKAGIHFTTVKRQMDSRFRGNDD